MEGSDCCGTCWFNARNEGRAGHEHADPPNQAHRTIRNLDLADPFYTNCANHPHRCREPDPIPIGPAYVGDATGTRQLWQPSPDTEEVRQHLLVLLAAVREQPATEYPMGLYRDEIVAWQLGEFGDARAIPDLKRLARFNPTSTEAGPFGRTRHQLVALARDALGKIHGAHP